MQTFAEEEYIRYVPPLHPALLRGVPHGIARASRADIQLLLGHQRATTTDIYLRSLEPQIGHLAEIIENAVKGKP